MLPASVAQAQGAAPTVSTVTITSNPGTDNTYATGDTITVGVTFSEAVTVSTTGGTPRITLDIGGQPRYASYSGDGTSAAAQAFSYTVLVSDQDEDGVSVVANSLALDGSTILATDDSADAALAHSAMSFADHKVDTEIVLASLRGMQPARSQSAQHRGIISWAVREAKLVLDSPLRKSRST